MDASGELQDFVTAGLSPEEHQLFLELPRGLALREHLREVPHPLRLGDMAAYLNSFGFPDDGTAPILRPVRRCGSRPRAR